MADLLDAIELGGVEAGERWLRSRGLPYSKPSRREHPRYAVRGQEWAPLPPADDQIKVRTTAGPA
ncbi:hypothetical protein GCM10009609_59210 [Pseudonocardia aurantiaca]|uniref:Uncharacterized protein n=1 Tax=Pseudonocardia aurantiaca TaxID=75290 RepID=A0ABW4FVC2_9PSEU